MPDGSPGFRVCVVIIDVSAYKNLALHTAVDQQRSTPRAALRDRLQARGHSLETRLDTDPDTRIHRHQPEDPL